MAQSPAIFDRRLSRQRMARAAAGLPATFLLDRVREDLVDRLQPVMRSFPIIADIASPGDGVASDLAARFRSSLVVRIGASSRGRPALVGDPESLPLAAHSIDLAVSALALHLVNDLPGALVQIRQALKPDGLFLGALVGGRTLHELRSVLTEAETTITGGASPRVAPFADVRIMGGLLQRAGFALPVADSETLTVRYDDLFALMADLRAMGATNALTARLRIPSRRAVFLRAAALYAERFADRDGRVRATFEIVSLSGWAPHESQTKPARRGSATVSLAEALAPGGIISARSPK